MLLAVWARLGGWLGASNTRAQVAFYMRKGADLLSKWVGEAEKQLRLLFEEAARHQPAIIFFDEIDGLAPVSEGRRVSRRVCVCALCLCVLAGAGQGGECGQDRKRRDAP